MARFLSFFEYIILPYSKFRNLSARPTAQFLSGPLTFLPDALNVMKHPAKLANLLATYQPNDTAMDMTIATLKRHKVAVLAAVTSHYSNGPI